MIRDLALFSLWLGPKVKPTTHYFYMSVLKRWSLFLNGRDPSPETVDAFLANLSSRGKDGSCHSVLTILRKYLSEWKHIEFDGRELYNKYCRKYRKAHMYRDYLERWRADKIRIRIGGRWVWMSISERRTRPEKCELCSRPTKRLVYHHWDNDNPAKGLWICSRCHWVAEAIEAVSKQDKLVNSYIAMKELVEEEFSTAG